MASSINITQLAGDSWNPSYHPIIQVEGRINLHLQVNSFLGHWMGRCFRPFTGNHFGKCHSAACLPLGEVH
jgi:hypothetical protein